MAVVRVYNNDNKNVLTQWRQHCTVGYCLYSIGGFADFAIKPYLWGTVGIVGQREIKFDIFEHY